MVTHYIHRFKKKTENEMNIQKMEMLVRNLHQLTPDAPGSNTPYTTYIY